MSTYELRVTGMTCDHCARTVEEVLSGVAGVQRSNVSYEDGKAKVEVQDAVESAALVAAINAKGYGAELLEREGNVSTIGASSGHSSIGANARLLGPMASAGTT